MPFVGRRKEPKLSRAIDGCCLTPRWTYFILNGVRWKCPKCSSVYEMEKREWAMDCVSVQWVKQDS